MRNIKIANATAFMGRNATALLVPFAVPLSLEFLL